MRLCPSVLHYVAWPMNRMEFERSGNGMLVYKLGLISKRMWSIAWKPEAYPILFLVNFTKRSRFTNAYNRPCSLAINQPNSSNSCHVEFFSVLIISIIWVSTYFLDLWRLSYDIASDFRQGRLFLVLSNCIGIRVCGCSGSAFCMLTIYSVKCTIISMFLRCLRCLPILRKSHHWPCIGKRQNLYRIE